MLSSMPTNISLQLVTSIPSSYSHSFPPSCPAQSSSPAQTALSPSLPRSEPEATVDGYEKTIQVTHIAHAALILRLLNHFDRDSGGRIILFSSDAHWPEKNELEKYPPAIPKTESLDTLVEVPGPGEEPQSDHMGRGFQRYANSKLAVVMWMYALNRRLEAHPTLHRITAIAVNPGNLADSRALTVNTPATLKFVSRFVIRPSLFLLRRFADPTMRTFAEAAADIVDFATRVDTDESPETQTASTSVFIL